ncbi:MULTISPECIES: flavin reductase family protein [Streptococcus]|uniref:Flavin reductase family protein n=1 Tax=Streptococcus caledonicus TaxID=2614158 RepID=A0ABW0UD61_9STRE|nr:flavin reductase [Streptococcus sp. S784/96/1]
MKQVFETTKCYLGYPVFILGYKDEDYGYNITTSSSSYSLSDMMVIGLFKGNNATKQIKKYGQFTVNVPTENLMLQIEQAGFHSSRDKLSLTKLDYTIANEIDAPLLTQCPISIECAVTNIQTHENYVNITARIVKRWVDDSLLDAKGRFNSRAFHPIEYMGDGKERVYRYLDDTRSDKLGHFMKQGKEVVRVENSRTL